MKNNKVWILLIAIFSTFIALPMMASAYMDYITYYDIGGTSASPLGISVNGTHMFVVDLSATEVYFFLYNGTYTGEHFDTAASGNGAPQRIDQNGTYFWITDSTDGRVYKYWMNGTYINYFASCTNPVGITVNQTNILVLNYSSGYMYSYLHNGTLQTTYPGAVIYRSDMVYDENNGSLNTFQIDGTNGRWGKYLTTTGATVFGQTYFTMGTAQQPVIQSNPTGIDSDGTYFFVVENDNDRIFKYYYNTTFEPINITGTCKWFTSPGHYDHIANRSCTSSDDYGIYFDTGDVVLDGNYYKQHWDTTSGNPSYMYYDVNHNNITIENLLISNAYSSAESYAFLNFNDSYFKNIIFTSSAGFYYGIFYSCSNSLIDNITVTPNPTSNPAGSFIFDPDDNLTIQNSNISMNSSLSSIQFIEQGDMKYLFLLNNTISGYNLMGAAYDLNDSIIANNTLNFSISYFNSGTTTWFYNNSVFNNIFTLNTTNSNLFMTRILNAPNINTTNQTGPNIIGGSYIGGNYYKNLANTGLSQTCIESDSDGFCDSAFTFFNATDYLPLADSYILFTSSFSWNNLSIEYSNKTFNVTLQYSVDVQEEPDAFMEYNGTNYTMLKSFSGNNLTFYYNLNVPAVTANYNETRLIRYYIYDTNGPIISSANTSRFYRMLIQNNNTNGALSTINFTCIDEVTSLATSCNITSAINVWNAGYYGEPYYRSYSLPRTAASSYLYYLYPPFGNYTADITGTYLGVSYPQRTYNKSYLNLTNTSQIKYLYLLSSSDGIYVSFTVVNAQGTTLPGASVLVTDVVGGTTVTTCQGYTDAAGTISCFLNPNAAATVTASHTSYGTAVYTIYPTNSAYTIVLGAATNLNISNPAYSITAFVNVTPESLVLNNDTLYNFTYYINSTYWNLTAYGMNITDENGDNLCNVTGTNSSGSTIYCNNVNTSSIEELHLVYWWSVGDEYASFELVWGVFYQYQGEYSIATLFDDIKNLWATDPAFGGSGSFTLALIGFAIILLIVGYSSWVSGIYSPFAIALVVSLATLFFVYVGFFDMKVALLMILITVAYVIADWVR